jgi:hypothetical protein
VSVASHIDNGSSKTDSDDMKWLVVLVLIVALVGGCANHQAEPMNARDEPFPFASPAISPSPTPSMPLQAQPIKQTWPNKYDFKPNSGQDRADYELSWEYPEITRANTHALRRFNSWIKKKILAHAARFRYLAKAERRGTHKRKVPIEWGLNLNFIVYYSDDKVISLRVMQRVMEAGQMHPINYYETLDYDLGKGRALRASDLFKRGYLRTFSKYSRRYLKDTYSLDLDWWVKKGTTPHTYNFANWNIVPDGMLLSFEDYQVSSHSFGQPEFVVPYSILKKVIKQSADRKYFSNRSASK